ncbi:Uma2 family endonuclease [Thermicanus aegyptius]|uniref:Uma2 family endonuclease n=1 Tax=Thermicanus aegyptius TaxID=94009 RepID=UPI00041D019A|nr:Uma2 family endonuclease [Thermicanus aegyptius]
MIRDDNIKEQHGEYEISERYEIINGIRYIFYLLLCSSENCYRIYTLLFSCGEEGKFLAPLDFHFDEENIVQLDLINISRERVKIIRDGYIFGVPDLVVEIMSESTGTRDKTIKKKAA